MTHDPSTTKPDEQQSDRTRRTTLQEREVQVGLVNDIMNCSLFMWFLHFGSHLPRKIFDVHTAYYPLAVSLLVRIF